MDKFLETQKLAHEEIEKLDKLVTVKKLIN